MQNSLWRDFAQRMRELDRLFDRISVDDIKASGDQAWEETMQEDCQCGADSRSECRCRRTEEYKKRSREIRREWWGDAWDKPLFGAQEVSVDARY